MNITVITLLMLKALKILYPITALWPSVVQKSAPSVTSNTDRCSGDDLQLDMQGLGLKSEQFRWACSRRRLCGTASRYLPPPPAVLRGQGRFFELPPFEENTPPRTFWLCGPHFGWNTAQVPQSEKSRPRPESLCKMRLTPTRGKKPTFYTQAGYYNIFLRSYITYQL